MTNQLCKIAIMQKVLESPPLVLQLNRISCNGIQAFYIIKYISMHKAGMSDSDIRRSIYSY